MAQDDISHASLPETGLTTGLPFSGLGFRLGHVAANALDRLHRNMLRASRSSLLRRRPGKVRNMSLYQAFGYDLLVLQAREIRGQ